MNVFDKICACLACILGGFFIILGIRGLFMGSKASFELSPILGGLPALIGWGIIKPIIIAWKKPASSCEDTYRTPPSAPPTPQP